MKVIIAGGRDFADFDAVKKAVADSGFEITQVVSGRARGADALGERWAFENGVPACGFQADWAAFGKKAGPLRNEAMAKYADALIALPGGRGTANMVKAARAYGLQVFEAKR